MQSVDVPANGESVYGYLHRLAHLNEHQSGFDLLAIFGWRLDRRFFERVRSVETDLGLPLNSLDPVCPKFPPLVPLDDWRFNRHGTTPICPSCIREARPHQKLWQHALVTACAIHSRLLVDVCPSCGDPWTFRSISISRCRCGLPLGQGRDQAASSIEIGIAELIGGASVLRHQVGPWSGDSV